MCETDAEYWSNRCWDRTRLASRGLLRAVAIIAVLVTSNALAAPCPVPPVDDPAAKEWSNKVIAAPLGDEACYADRSPFTNSDCNIFAGRVLEQAYGVRD